MNFLKKIKALNRERIDLRRQDKFKRELNNNFDRSALQLSYLAKTLPSLAAPRVGGAPKSREPSLAVYSTYMGASSVKTLNRRPVDDRVPHLFISNNEEVLRLVESLGWQPIYLPLELSANRLLSAQQAKIAKALPHLFSDLQEFNYLMYVDDKIDFSVDKLINWVEEPTTQAPWSLKIRHHNSLRGNILHEFGTAMIQPRYQAQRDQAASYITQKVREGLELDVGCMYWTSAILRNTTHPDTTTINEHWYKDILACGIECQIAFDFVAQRFNSIRLLPPDIA